MKRRQHQHLLESLVHSTAKQQGDFTKTAELTIELLCQNVTVSLASVWTFSSDQQTQSLEAQFGSMMLQDIHRPKRLQDCPRYLHELQTHRYIDAGNTVIDPRLSELANDYFIPLQIHSSLEVGIRINGHLEGVLCLERAQVTSHWHDSEIHLACQMADQLALTLAIKHSYEKEESLSLFRCAAEQSKQISMLVNLHTEKVEYVNQAHSDITGIPREQIIGANLRELSFFKQHGELAEQSLAQIFKGEIVNGEVQFQRADGSHYWIQYVLSQFITERGNHYALVSSVENTGEHNYRSELERLAWRCGLTGLYNRTHFNRVLERTTQGVLLFVDLLGFKRFNDTYGHDNGDSLLIEIAHRIRHFPEFNKAIEIARVGSDEFAVLLTESNDLDYFSHRLYQHLSMPILIGREQIEPKPALAIVDIASVVGTFSPLTCADIAVQYAKKRKGNAIQVFNNALLNEFKEDAQIERDLHSAISGRQFELYYQPLRDLEQNTYIGAEALIRWHHPKRGVLFPASFINIAEQSGVINAIGSWVLEAACRQLNLWQHHNADMTMHVNVSARQFFSGNLFEQVWQLLIRYRLKPKTLILEITETELMGDVRHATLLCQELAELGVGLAIDDFGTGYSSMRYLKQFPISKLKIDRSFVSDLTVSRESREIVSAIIAMANALNISLTAEGVETVEQEAFLAKKGCHQAQGYLYSPALREPEFAQFLLLAQNPVLIAH
ncbi:sensor domain-containing phosphodiesterase [Shewanella glacialipiscicola]|uniref:sensor domain-containing phosphodiesterase n=1 Tax=Shewanella glacialipiscicola TaxID=614069 RepID=UPI001C8157CD|nr:GGDEF domain-containing phosphodiesterase [Shewanella glacialipiscicola]MCL1084750.1 EAL domain-containing protein [Shewanella glacialipiscicola]MCU7995945.1 EAL domain-containing protein [Shewanella glacialipiscicola]MCU8027198.1 EAL domain-containing protein [Shewanella glacialipiscicola]